MNTSVSILRRWQALLFMTVLVACVVMAYRDGGEAFATGTFSPTSSVGLCDQFSGPPPNAGDPICTDAPGSLATNNPSDVTTALEIGGADYDYSLLANTSPGTGFTAPGPGYPGFVPGVHPALGDVMGQIVSEENVGPTNDPCGSPFASSWKFLNGTVDNSPANILNPVPYALTNPPPTTPPFGGVLENHHTDTGTAPNADPAYIPPAGIPMNGLAASVDRYPSFLNAIFDPDFSSYGPNQLPFDGDDVNGPAPPVQPVARYVANLEVATFALEINLVVFLPGALASAFPAPHPFADLSADMGTVTLTIFHDPTQVLPQFFTETLCTERSSIQTLYGESRENKCNGDPVTCNLTAEINNPTIGSNLGTDRARTPPSAGSYLYASYLNSQRDADEDGYENGLDTCPNIANTDASPKVSFGPDSDMIDSACDSTPLVDTGMGNHDGDVLANGDGIINIQDNCPQVANASQKDAEAESNHYNAFAVNPAPQGGPKADEIGDDCDPDDVQANGDYLADLDLGAKCIGGVDADGDGWCTAIGSGIAASDPSDIDAARTPEDFDLVFPMPVATAGAGDFPGLRHAESGVECSNAVDDDRDFYVNDGCPVLPASSGLPEAAKPSHCDNGVDDDLDTVIDDGCMESGAQCDDSTDDDTVPGDTAVNDGCPIVTERLPFQVCNDGVDNDGDTLIDNLDSAAGNSTCRPVALATHPGHGNETSCMEAFDSDGDTAINDGCPASGVPESGVDCGDALDNDVDTLVNDGCPVVNVLCAVAGCAVDADGDGYTNEAERHAGTNPLGRCGVGASPPVGQDWPSDLTSGGIPPSTDRITLTDITAFNAIPKRMNTNPADLTFDVRLDVVPGPGILGTWININDLFALTLGVTGSPPMYSGLKAFNNPLRCDQLPDAAGNGGHPIFGR
jgi:hypothetical protein